MNDMAMTVTFCLGLSLAAFAGAFVCLLAGKERAGLLLMASGWSVDGVLVALNGLAAGEPPLGNMYHVMTALPLCFAPLYCLLRWRDGRGWLHSHIAAACILPLAGAFFMDRDVHWQRMPVLQSWWFVPHVLSYLVSYALAAIAFVLTVSRLATIRGRAHQDPAGDPRGEAARLAVRYAVPFMTFGLLSGALWADDAWGVYWSWDPKETWSLITWLLYVGYLHAWHDPRWRRYGDVVQLLAFAALIVTFLVVNLLPKIGKSLHSYA